MNEFEKDLEQLNLSYAQIILIKQAVAKMLERAMAG